MLQYMKILNVLITNRFWIYAFIAGIFLAFLSGFWASWKIQKAFTTTANMKLIEKDLKIKEKQDEIDSIPYDSQRLISVLRSGEL